MQFKLILLSQLKKSEIIYQENFLSMTLIKNGKAIAYTKKNQNLFIFNCITSKKVISLHLVSQNKKIRI